MQFSFFDLHCDTATEMYSKKERLSDNSLAVSLQKANGFDRYVQVMAVWTDKRLDNESGWNRLHDVIRYLRADDALQAPKAELVSACPKRFDSPSLILALEDARVLNGKLDRVFALSQLGIRIITPLWGGETCIGGSHDTESGLTDFGKEAIRTSIRLGMIPDISHASLPSADEIFSLAAASECPVIASHSNAYGICPVSRNLRDEQIQAIRASGGVIGLNLYRNFLSTEHDASREDILRHIEYFLERDCQEILCFGCDMDGAELPHDVPDLSAIPPLREYLLRYYSESVLNKLFFENSYSFAKRHL
ncbi:MAG: membrane dipeptidase [Clostridia bacterium]|nr:membrane dipeptidase [Clostridia bacterium]